MTKEHKLKIKLALTGKKKSVEHCKNMGLTKVGNTNMLGKHHSEKTKNKISKGHLGMKKPWATFHNKIPPMLGKKHKKETKLKMSDSRQGENHWNWQSGITPLRRLIRNSFLYKDWVNNCFIRDYYTCKKCFQKGGEMHVHHIKSFESIFKENNIKNIEEAIKCKEFWNMNNGVTLCKKCHKNFHSIYGQKETNLEQINKFTQNG